VCPDCMLWCVYCVRVCWCRLCSGVTAAMMWPFPRLPKSIPAAAVPLAATPASLTQEMQARDANRCSSLQPVMNRVVFDSLLPPDDPVGPRLWVGVPLPFAAPDGCSFGLAVRLCGGWGRSCVTRMPLPPGWPPTRRALRKSVSWAPAPLRAALSFFHPCV
jgi:hypothetical protein